MKKVWKKIFVTTIVMCCLLGTIPVMAQTGERAENNVLQLKKINWSVDNTRGNYISSSHAGISNAGGGAIGISGITTAHEVVDKIRIHLYLDRLDSDSRWTQVDDFDFTFLPEDVPNGDLSEATVSFEVYNQPSGYYYRVRGTHGVWKNGVVETQSTRTDGVMITATP